MGKITVKVLREAGHEEALLGMSLSHGTCKDRAARAARLAPKQGGHNKFLESIILWLDVRAARYWWQQADTYRVATKQSESTMHTILKRPLMQGDFARLIHQPTLDRLNGLLQDQRFEQLKNELPEGFLQRRIWCMSYKTLQNICMQRQHHRLREWPEFVQQVLEQIERPEYILPAMAKTPSK